MSSSKRPRIAFLDIDGTIIDHNGAVAPSTVATIQQLRADGHLVYICTGRAACHIPDRVAEIGFDGAITNSGAFARVGDDLVVNKAITPAHAGALTAALVDRGIDFLAQADDAMYVTGERLAANLEERIPAGESLLLESPPLDSIAKIVFFGTPPITVQEVRELAGPGFHTVDGSIPVSGWVIGEITEQGTTKGDAITAVLDHLGLDAADAIGVGDSWNDAEMFAVCGESVAMGNAPAELQALADHVTSSVDADGIRDAFVTLGLVPSDVTV